jgi:GT2 family glycosyltransferase
MAERDPSIGIIGPLMFRHDNPDELWFYQYYLPHDAGRNGLFDVPLVIAGALLVKRDVIRRIGLFDDNYFFYHEEWDLCFRARKAGYRTVCATSVRSWHKLPRDEQSKLYIPKRAYFWHRNFFIFAGRHFRKTRSAFDFLFRNLIFYGEWKFPCFYVLSALRKKRFDAVKSYFQGIKDGAICYLKLSLID